MQGKNEPGKCEEMGVIHAEIYLCMQEQSTGSDCSASDRVRGGMVGTPGPTKHEDITQEIT